MNEYAHEIKKMPERTAALHNLGCKVNAYETDRMENQLKNAGYRIVGFDEIADVYVVNTCSVTNIADRKSRQMLHRARKMNPRAVIVAAGCYVNTNGLKNGKLPARPDESEGRKKACPEDTERTEGTGKTGREAARDADIYLDNEHKEELVEALEAFFSHSDVLCPVSRSFADTDRDTDTDTDTKGNRKGHTRSFLKVQDGCNQFCSYCIIPYARGRIRSQKTDEICRELEQLHRSGVKEAVLTGIHLSSYGKDRNDGETLLTLIKRAAEVMEDGRIRLGSLEPGIITEPFARELAAIPQLCPHFHLSLQSGCDTVLRRMNRRYTAEEYARKCEILRSYFRQPALTTDVIAGFPGESEEEFLETERFLRRISLYETHIFKYSLREGTAAARMTGQVPETVKNQRSERLILLGKENKEKFVQSWDGERAEVLFEEEILSLPGLEGSFYTGYTKEYLKVYTPASRFPVSPENRIMSGTIHYDRKRNLLNFDVET